MSTKLSNGGVAATTVNDSNNAAKLTILAALGLLVGYGSYQLSKSIIMNRKKNNFEEKKADYKNQKLKVMEI